MTARPEQARPGNRNRVEHGGYSPVLVRSRATVEKRRLLRQVGLKLEDLESVGRALLTNWARAAAALSLLDDYASREGWLDDDGEPRGFARLYVSLLNAERLALRELERHVRAANSDASSELRRYLESRDG